MQGETSESDTTRWAWVVIFYFPFGLRPWIDNNTPKAKLNIENSIGIVTVILQGVVIISFQSSGVVVRSTGAYEKLSRHPARLVLGWVARVECPVPSHYTCQADQSGYRESVSWLSTVLRKRRKIKVPPTWCSMLGGVKDTTQGVKV